MKIVIYYGGNSKGDNPQYDKLMQLLEFREIHMTRVPNKGEILTLYLDDCRVEMVVKQVFPHYCPPFNDYIKPSRWGEWYGLEVDNAEIVEWYGK